MFLIRGDGNSRIGIGHLMRCLTIAEEAAALLQGGKEEICFVCADEASEKFIRENGFRTYVLKTDYRDMEAELPFWRDVGMALLPRQESWKGWQSGEETGKESQSGEGTGKEPQSGEGTGTELPTKESGKRNITILVDSYYVTDRYLTALGEMGYTVLMDDMGIHRYPVDCVVNYNAQADLQIYESLYRGSSTRLLIGSRYTPLRKQFRRADAASLNGTASAASVNVTGGTAAAELTVREVLITTGGGDSGNLAGRILKRIYRDDILFHVVTGCFRPDFRNLQELEKEYGQIRLHYDVKDMAGLMRRCQIAVTAGGSTIYELAALGVPFICFSYTENQEALVKYMGEGQIAGSAGAWHKEPDRTLDRIESLFAELVSQPERRQQSRIREMQMVDGEGAGRLALAILNRTVP